MSTLIKSRSIDECVEVKTAWAKWQEAKTHLEKAQASTKKLKLTLHPDSFADEVKQLEAQADLPTALKEHAKAITAEGGTKAAYEAIRQAELTKRSGPLKAKFREAMRRREAAMDEVIKLDNEVLAVCHEAQDALGRSQRVIPTTVQLPWLDASSGESWWESLKQYYRREYQLNL